MYVFSERESFNSQTMHAEQIVHSFNSSIQVKRPQVELEMKERNE